MQLIYQNKITIFITSFLLLLVAFYLNSNDGVCLSSASITHNYTYIIVGAGTAGCVLAARLSENPNNSVLLIEAGSGFNMLSKIPLFAPLLQGSSYDWSFLSEPQQWSFQGMFGKQQRIPRGKGLGGSAQINFMVHGFLELQDLHTWETMGINDFKKYVPELYNYLFNRTINVTSGNKRKSRYKSHVEEMKWSLSKVLEAAINQSNVPNLKFCRSFSTIKSGQRWTTFDSHLKPALTRPNLHILCNTEVFKILIKDKRAYGVRGISSNSKRNYYAEEIILSSGSINSPKLLMLSGIGDAKLLQRLNISVVADVPGVGRNFHDHLNMPIYISINSSISLTVSKVLSLKEISNYIFYKDGVLGKFPIAGIAYSPSNFSITLFGLGSAEKRTFTLIGNYKPEILQAVFPYYSDFSKEGFVFLTVCAQPRSRGYILLKSSKFTDPPIINPKHLKDTYDIECTINALEVLKKLIQTKAFREIGAKIHWPQIKQCKEWKDFNYRSYFECIIRFAAMTGYHPAGTCKMGDHDDSSAVVDRNFRVKNIKSLRIIDTSTFPTPVSTFPNSIMVAIAEYASEVISAH